MVQGIKHWKYDDRLNHWTIHDWYIWREEELEVISLRLLRLC